MSDNESPKPVKRARPQSVIAQKFSLDLEAAFGLDGTFERSQSIEDKKFAVNTQSAELEALEARLRATEERLRARTGGQPLPNAAAAAANAQGGAETNGVKGPGAGAGPQGSRPGTAKAQGGAAGSRPGTAKSVGAGAGAGGKKAVGLRSDVVGRRLADGSNSDDEGEGGGSSEEDGESGGGSEEDEDEEDEEDDDDDDDDDEESGDEDEDDDDDEEEEEEDSDESSEEEEDDNDRRRRMMRAVVADGRKRPGV